MLLALEPPVWMQRSAGLRAPARRRRRRHRSCTSLAAPRRTQKPVARRRGRGQRIPRWSAAPVRLFLSGRAPGLASAVKPRPVRATMPRRSSGARRHRGCGARGKSSEPGLNKMRAPPPWRSRWPGSSSPGSRSACRFSATAATARRSAASTARWAPRAAAGCCKPGLSRLSSTVVVWLLPSKCQRGAGSWTLRLTAHPHLQPRSSWHPRFATVEARGSSPRRAARERWHQGSSADRRQWPTAAWIRPSVAAAREAATGCRKGGRRTRLSATQLPTAPTAPNAWPVG
mmetsp:Transcript_39771/g.114022  ORF Transcript_39771/g.114022 Transcript_39771/m.114022 type:complete len:287 (+) Transcript_39771:489-1349(+)